MKADPPRHAPQCPPRCRVCAGDGIAQRRQGLAQAVDLVPGGQDDADACQRWLPGPDRGGVADQRGQVRTRRAASWRGLTRNAGKRECRQVFATRPETDRARKRGIACRTRWLHRKPRSGGVCAFWTPWLGQLHDLVQHRKDFREARVIDPLHRVRPAAAQPPVERLGLVAQHIAG